MYTRYIVQSLPRVLLGGVGIALAGTRALQLVQSKVFHVIPFGLLTKFSIVDACVGILVSGLFMLYFGGWHAPGPMHPWAPLRPHPHCTLRACFVPTVCAPGPLHAVLFAAPAPVPSYPTPTPLPSPFHSPPPPPHTHCSRGSLDPGPV